MTLPAWMPPPPPPPGESSHTVEKLLRACFRQGQQELRGASDFPRERPTTALIWRSFIDYGAFLKIDWRDEKNSPGAESREEEHLAG